jgi:hypothetical protein
MLNMVILMMGCGAVRYMKLMVFDLMVAAGSGKERMDGEKPGKVG